MRFFTDHPRGANTVLARSMCNASKGGQLGCDFMGGDYNQLSLLVIGIDMGVEPAGAS